MMDIKHYFQFHSMNCQIMIVNDFNQNVQNNPKNSKKSHISTEKNDSLIFCSKIDLYAKIQRALTLKYHHEISNNLFTA